MTAPTQTTSSPPFDYKAELKRITLEIETTLKSKLEAAIANLQTSVDELEKKFDQKLSSQIDSLRSTQADKSTQESHSRELEEITKNLRYLINKVSLLVDTKHPTSVAGAGHL